MYFALLLCLSEMQAAKRRFLYLSFSWSPVDSGACFRGDFLDGDVLVDRTPRPRRRLKSRLRAFRRQTRLRGFPQPRRAARSS